MQFSYHNWYRENNLLSPFSLADDATARRDNVAEELIEPWCCEMHRDSYLFTVLQPLANVRSYQAIAIDSSDVCKMQACHRFASTFCFAIGSGPPAIRQCPDLKGR